MRIYKEGGSRETFRFSIGRGLAFERAFERLLDFGSLSPISRIRLRRSRMRCMKESQSRKIDSL